METDSYSANQRRAINLVWTACGDYQFGPQFLALKADGTPDFYMNCVIGLVRKWLGDEMPRRLFALRAADPTGDAGYVRAGRVSCEEGDGRRRHVRAAAGVPRSGYYPSPTPPGDDQFLGILLPLAQKKSLEHAEQEPAREGSARRGR